MEKTMKNSGHRLGASGTNLENTVQGLRNSMENIEQDLTPMVKLKEK